MILLFVCNNIPLPLMMAINFCLVLWKKNLEEKINSKRSFSKFQASSGRDHIVAAADVFAGYSGEWEVWDSRRRAKQVRDVQKLKQ
jgi:hypothetical protein